MSIFLIIYLTGFLGYETKAVIDYHDESQKSRVVTKGETLVIDTATNLAWPVKAVYSVKRVLNE